MTNAVMFVLRTLSLTDWLCSTNFIFLIDFFFHIFSKYLAKLMLKKPQHRVCFATSTGFEEVSLTPPGSGWINRTLATDREVTSQTDIKRLEEHIEIQHCPPIPAALKWGRTMRAQSAHNEISVVQDTSGRDKILEGMWDHFSNRESGS